jgi:transposase
MVMELSAKKWLIGFGDRSHDRRVSADAWDTVKLVREVAKAKEKFKLDSTVRVLCVQEAGRDGFAVHRFLESQGIESLIVDSSSIEVPRQARRTKTDRVDADALLRMLRRYAGGETKVWRVLHVPSEAEEEARRSHRELNRLKKERTSLTNRMRSILATQGIHWSGRIGGDFSEAVRKARRWDGGELPETALKELDRAMNRWDVMEGQIEEIESSHRTSLKKKNAEPGPVETSQRLKRLKGIGETSSWFLTHEFFWRKFSNRREVGAAAGLTESPYKSGEMDWGQGISKAGNGRVRAVMIELSWGWVRWQPGSALSRWFEERFAHGSRRMRRVGIVAVARKLLIALWRYLDQGLIPDGARLSA